MSVLKLYSVCFQLSGTSFCRVILRRSRELLHTSSDLFCLHNNQTHEQREDSVIAYYTEHYIHKHLLVELPGHESIEDSDVISGEITLFYCMLQTL